MSMPRQNIVKVDLEDRLQRFERNILLATADKYANRFGAYVYRFTEKADLSGYTVKGYFLRPDGTTITIDGTVEDNKATVVLPPNCYYYDGGFTLTVKLHSSNGSYAHTIAIFDGVIAQTTTDTVIDNANAFSPSDAVLRRNNHNLLDNSYFINPVNQRGKSAYTGAGYTIDRWRQSNAYTTTTVGAGFVRFAASGGIAYPRQYVQFYPGMYGKTYTAAVCTSNGAITVASALITEDAVDTETTLASATIASGVTLRITKASDGRISVRLDISDGNSVSLRWAALYEGAYTKDNLPPYEYKGCSVELLECERYCFAVSQYALYHHATINTNSITFTIPIPIRMRLKPSYESGTWLVCNANGVVQSGFAFSVEVLGNGFLRITATKTAHGLSSAALRADTDIVLSADL